MSFIEDSAALEWLLESPDGPVGRDLDRRGNRVLAAMVADCPRDTTQLANSLGMVVARDDVSGGELEARIGVDRLERTETTGGPGTVDNADVFVFVNEGTDHGHYVIPPNPFARRALQAGRG